MPVADDLFEDADRDDQTHPVTRGQMRVIVSDLRKDLRWAVAVTIVANQTLNHIELPPVAGIVGGLIFISFAAAKLVLARS